MFKKKPEVIPPEEVKEIWTPPKAEKVKYEWFARHILLANLENQLNQLEDQDYFDIEIRHIVPGDKVANASIFVTARKKRENK
jgi:hypothetical protein